MAEVIGVRFRNVGKTYYFDPNGVSLKIGDNVIVETSRGTDFGTIVLENREAKPDEFSTPLTPILRIATDADRATVSKNIEKEKEAMRICQQKIEHHHLNMKLDSAEYSFEGNKILFYFTADGRVDFRELVKDLASVFHTRIELRQIGVRDEAKMLGGLGICGRPFCCTSFLGEFLPVSIKMAKEQGLSLNPTKISGTCGRLMCCLKYEQNVYSELIRLMPKVGAWVSTKEGNGVVISNNILAGESTVKLESNPDIPKIFSKDEITVIKNSGGKNSSREASAPKETPAEK